MAWPRSKKQSKPPALPCRRSDGLQNQVCLQNPLGQNQGGFSLGFFIDAPAFNSYTLQAIWQEEGKKTFLIDLPILILFGALFAIFEKSGRGGIVFSSAYYWRGVMFTTLFNVAVFYATINFPDWMWMYFVEDSANTWGELIYIFIFMYYLPYTLGFYLGYDFKNRSILLFIVLLLVMLGTEAWLIHSLYDRYAYIGTLEEYLAGDAVYMFSSKNPLGPIMNSSVAAMVLYYIFVIYQHRQSGRKTLSL